MNFVFLNFVKKLPKPIIIKILDKNICNYVFTSLYPYIKNSFDELFMWRYFFSKYEKYSKNSNIINKCLRSNNMEVVQLGIELGADQFNRCLYSSNIEVILFGIRKLRNLKN